MSCDVTVGAIRLLVTVLKHVAVKEFKEALADLIGQNLSSDLIQLAEIKDNCIVRILVLLDHRGSIAATTASTRRRPRD